MSLRVSKSSLWQASLTALYITLPERSLISIDLLDSIAQLYAFAYVPNSPLPTKNGWSVYSPREEFGRMGIGSRSKAWRFTDINKDYSVSTPLHQRGMLVRQ